LNLTAMLLALAGCSHGTIDLSGAATAGLVEGMIFGREFVLRHGGSNRMIAGHHRLALFLFDVEEEPCNIMPEEPEYLRVGIGLPLEVGRWSIDEPEIEGASVSRGDEGGGMGTGVDKGWVQIDDFRNPWEEGESWITGALDFETDDGSWVEGRFVEVPLCYTGY
jgi:hypothetical protein